MSHIIPSFDIFTGSETGFLKACCFQNKSPVPINRVEEPKKEFGINCLAWGNEEKSKIYTGCKYGRVLCYCLKSSSCVQLHNDEISEKNVILKDMRISESDLMTILAFGSGQVKITNFKGDHFNAEPDEQEQSCNEINAGLDLYCIDQNVHSRNQILTGGKKNPLKIWDITKPNEPPTFTAKNVKNDWLNLHVPIWVTKAQFVPDSKKVITGTGYSQIRLYDTSSSQRRPVIEMKYEENPITAMAIRPGADYQVVVGNTIGNIALLDLRNKSIVRGFKGSRGGVTDIKFHPSRNVFAGCGVDRFVNCYDLEYKAPLYSVYMHSSLNCLLFSSNWSPDDYVEVVKEKKEPVTDDADYDDTCKVEDGEDGGLDDILNSMDVVKTKKRKLEVSISRKNKKKNK